MYVVEEEKHHSVTTVYSYEWPECFCGCVIAAAMNLNETNASFEITYYFYVIDYQNFEGVHWTDHISSMLNLIETKYSKVVHTATLHQSVN